MYAKQEKREIRRQRSKFRVQSLKGGGEKKRDEMCKNKAKAFGVSANPAGREKRTYNKVSQLD